MYLFLSVHTQRPCTLRLISCFQHVIMKLQLHHRSDYLVSRERFLIATAPEIPWARLQHIITHNIPSRPSLNATGATVRNLKVFDCETRMGKYTSACSKSDFCLINRCIGASIQDNQPILASRNFTTIRKELFRACITHGVCTNSACIYLYT